MTILAPGFTILPATSPADIADVASLFRHYAATLPITLEYQEFDAELSGLPGKYSAPWGALLIVRDAEGEAAGCAALRPLSLPDVCEMKRLFTLPSTRGTGLGRMLTEAVIDQARQLGYLELKLDTLPTMEAAIRLYKNLGFQPCAPYYAPTPPQTVFMSLRL